MRPYQKKFTQQGVLVPSLLILIGLLIMALAIELEYISDLKQDKLKSSKPDQPRTVNPRDLHIDFSLPTVDGGTINMVDLRGKYVLVNFWASWCPPCVREMPTLDIYYQAHRDQDFELVAVNYAESIETVVGFAQFNGFSFPIALDASGVVFNGQYQSDSLPTSFLIGPDGALVKAWPPGALSSEILDRDVTPLLQE